MEEMKPVPDLNCVPFVTAVPSDSKETVALKLRAEAHRRAEIASRMRFGKTRACEFAFISGLNRAADLLTGDHFYLACPKPDAVCFDEHGPNDKDDSTS